jgi:hypothetical protein
VPLLCTVRLLPALARTSLGQACAPFRGYDTRFCFFVCLGYEGINVCCIHERRFFARGQQVRSVGLVSLSLLVSPKRLCSSPCLPTAHGRLDFQSAVLLSTARLLFL